MSFSQLRQPVFLPLYGLIPIIFGAYKLYNSAQINSTCDISAQGELCGLGDSLMAVFFVALGIIYALIVSLIVVIKFRKQMVWRNLIVLWLMFSILGLGIVLVAKYHNDAYANTHGINGQAR